MNQDLKKIIFEWWHYVISAKKNIVPAFAISTLVIFYIFIIKFQDYNWYNAGTYIQCYYIHSPVGSLLDLNTIIEVLDENNLFIHVACNDIVDNLTYRAAFYKIIFFIIRMALYLILTTVGILSMFGIFNILNKYISDINKE